MTSKAKKEAAKTLRSAGFKLNLGKTYGLEYAVNTIRNGSDPVLNEAIETYLEELVYEAEVRFKKALKKVNAIGNDSTPAQRKKAASAYIYAEDKFNAIASIY